VDTGFRPEIASLNVDSALSMPPLCVSGKARHFIG